MSSWKTINLFGAARIARVVGIYEITLPRRVPGGSFKIKVIESMDGSFAAFPNVCLKSSIGEPEWISGLGRSEAEALEDALRWFMRELDARPSVKDDDFEWSDPIDFL